MDKAIDSPGKLSGIMFNLKEHITPVEKLRGGFFMLNTIVN